MNDASMLPEEITIFVATLSVFFVFFFGIFIGWRIDLRQRQRSTRVISNVKINELESKLEYNQYEFYNMIANVSHEIRTPLMSIIALVDNIIDGIDDWNQDNGENIIGYCEKLNEVISYMLDASSISAGGRALKIMNVNVANWVNECTQLLTKISTKHEVAFRIEVTPSNLEYDFDENRMAAVLCNFLTNAMRHSKENSAILIRASMDDDKFNLLVYNEGTRLTPDDEYLFDRFESKSTARINDNPINGGTGIGLSIASWFTKIHGGTVHIVLPEDHGLPPEGAAFLTILPKASL